MKPATTAHVCIINKYNNIFQYILFFLFQGSTLSIFHLTSLECVLYFPFVEYSQQCKTEAITDVNHI